jgi:hypothetical protein
VAAVDRDLLERLHQLARALEVGHQLVGGVRRLRGIRRAASAAAAGMTSLAKSSQRRAKLDATSG